MSKRATEEEHVNYDRYLVTYADLITLLMIFFVVMYAISSVNAQKFQSLAASLGAALSGGGSVLDGGYIVEPEYFTGFGDKAEGNQYYSTVINKVREYIEEQGLEHQIDIVEEERGVIIRFQDTILFAKGSDALTPQAEELITKIGKILQKVPGYIKVEGHTDNLQIHNSKFKSNWELSVLRATSVVHILVEKTGIDPKLISATGYGEYRPVAPNNSEENYAKNRRVDIVLLKQEYNTVEPDQLN